MKLERGDVAIIDYPFSTGTGTKVRPVLIVQSDARNKILDHTIVAMISKNLSHAATDPTQHLVALASPDGAAAGLNADSVVKCGNLFTIHESLVRKKIGELSPATMQQVDSCLKNALALKSSKTWD